MPQRDKLLKTIIKLCNAQGERTFRLRKLQAFCDYEALGIGGSAPEATVRRLLQNLRDEGKLLLNRERGLYTLLDTKAQMNQRDRLHRLIIDCFGKRDRRTFSLTELYEVCDYKKLEIEGRTPQATVRKLLRMLRDRGQLLSNEQRGIYTLVGSVGKLGQRDRLHEEIIRVCDRIGRRTFTLPELYRLCSYKKLITIASDKEALVRRLLGELVDDGRIFSNEERGRYTLLNRPVLKGELEDESIQDAVKDPNEQEYLTETQTHSRAWWKRQAKKKLGYHCIYRDCGNTFTKKNKQPYIEVHHIIPLCEGGEDALDNLAVVCAHHHRMAHFANEATKKEVEDCLREETRKRLVS